MFAAVIRGVNTFFSITYVYQYAINAIQSGTADTRVLISICGIFAFTLIHMPLMQASDIEVRVQSVSKSRNGQVGATLLLYITARAAMNALDDAYGGNGWQRTHELIDGDLYCNIDIWDAEKGVWVRKQDVM